LHCHLLAGLDDGPKSDEEALAMCRLAYEDGTRMSVALAHQNEHWPANTTARIREAVHGLAQRLREKGLALTVFPCAEVMVHPGLVESWQKGELLSVADRRQYLLIEMPDGLFVELGEIVGQLRQAKIRPILAHPERHPELLQDDGRIEDLIRARGLVQLSSGSVTHPKSREDERAVKEWVKRGVVHVLGSDGHSRRRRPPTMGEAYRRITGWAGSAVADRVCSTNGLAVLNGLPVRGPEPMPRRARWFRAFW